MATSTGATRAARSGARREKRRPNTARAYDDDWRVWELFCEAVDPEQRSLVSPYRRERLGAP